ncbi:MAG: DUF4038 domain-containing protein [bacterium]|nr:DUF4038 domain-containing protein [bacterium]
MRLLIAALAVICVACGEAESPRSAQGSFEGIPGRLDSSDPNVPLFGVFELALGAQNPGTQPYVDGPEVSARFEGASGPAKSSYFEVQGFWDGDNVWRIRFSPILEGDWIWATSSQDMGLAGVSGRIHALAPDEAALSGNLLRRGFLERDGYGWELSDGSSFLPVGEVQWGFAEEFSLEEVKNWIDALHEFGLNGFLGSVWRARSDRGGLQPFDNADPKTERVELAYFERLDAIVRYANQRGVIPGLAIGGFPGDSDWYAKFGTQERHDRWFRYVVSRYAAFNVRWILFGDVDAVNPPWDSTWQESVAYYARLAKDVDPWDHPLGSHHSKIDSSSASNPDIDYVQVQTSSSGGDPLENRRWGKPIWSTDRPDGGLEDPNALRQALRATHRHFVAGLAFPTLGSRMNVPVANPQFPPARAVQQGVELRDFLLEYDLGLRRLAEFKRFYEELDRRHFEPAAERCSRGICGRFGESLALMLEGGGSVSVDLRDMPGQFRVRALEISTGQLRTLPRIRGGEVRTIDTGSDRDTALVLSHQG